ncbi:MAG: ATP-dependent zinc metalloprotease FtsH [Pirellulaceae bacterium]|nr:ATP-dependent zinc metalloprotease FtsH [Pirellulaceae bacterium]
MDEQRRTGDGNADENRPGFRGMNIWIAITALVLVLAALLMIWTPKSSQVKLSFVIQQIEGVDGSGLPIEKDGEPIGCNVESLKFQGNKVSGVFKDPPLEPDFEKVGATSGRERKKLEKEFYAITGPADSPDYQRVVKAAEQQNVPREYAQETNPSAWLTIILFAFMIGAVFFVWGQIRRQQSQMLNGGGFLSGFNRSPAKKYEGADQQITFKDVAGLEGVKADLQEIVEYLKEPEKFRKLGGRVPKGVLLNGPPGTGKTLLARAVAGEADVPYYSVSGSEFIQMFVGVGASRVRDLFGTAKENSPAIIFVDEIDAVGRQRGAGLGGGHDEREQTLNQILSEMDGFSGADSVIVLAATNRPDVLDPALLRPGRFDRHVTVSRPTQKGRVAIFKVHVRDVPLASDVDLDVLASGCIGLTGADIRNMVNEAALWAARKNKTKVEMSDFEHARDKILMGAKREEVLSDKEKEKTAYHEVGHTLAAWFLEGSHPVHKVTIIPRGQALGVTQMMPSEDKLNMSESELRDELVVLLSGRAAEKLIYDEVSVGAENDLERATNLARRMVMNWGMSAKIGPVSYKVTGDDPFLGREINQQRQFSEHTMETIDEEVVSILNQASRRATQLLEEKREELRELTQALINSEELDRFAIEKVIGPSVHKPMAIEENSDTAEAESAQSTTDENVASDVSPENQLADAGAEASDSADHAGQSS